MNHCALCDLKLSDYSIKEGENNFCCPGCHAVFRILSGKNQIENYQETTIFKHAVSAGLISNPALLEQLSLKQKKFPQDDLEKLHLEIKDMWCPACAEIIRLILLQQNGIRSCIIDYTTDMGAIEFAPKLISKEMILSLINGLGYQSFPLGVGIPVSKILILRFGIAAFCALNVMMLAYPIYSSLFHGDPELYNPLLAWVSFALSLPVITYCAWPIWRRFFLSFSVGLFGMESLVIIGISTSFGLSLFELMQGSHQIYFDSMTFIVALVLLGKIIEEKAKFSVKQSLINLAKSIPRKGRKKLSDGNFQFVPIKEIEPNDLVAAFSGEKIVLDGIVEEGEGMCDESLITGEAIPVIKKKGSKLIGGSILKGGNLTYRVSNTVEESILHRILDVAQKEMDHKTIYIRAADSIVRFFVPCVLLIAFLAGAFSLFFEQDSIQMAIIRALSVLLISCPCAIGIAAPLAEACLMNKLAQLGAIVRNRGVLALLGKTSIFVFDKTGTITEGCFKVLQGLENLNPQLKKILKGISSRSNHPLAKAISEQIEEIPAHFEHIEEHAGKGLKGFFNGKLVLIGSREWLLSHGFTAELPSFSGVSTCVFFAVEKEFVIPIILGDSIRDGAIEVVSALSLSSKTVLLSGDNEPSVACVGRACGFSYWQSVCSPLEKKEYINSLRKEGHMVCMLGDGINDAPALAAAHIGVSVVTATDISIQVSDLLLTTDRLQIIPKICKLASEGQKIVKQNLFWAFFYNIIGIGLACFGWLSPLFAAFAMTISSLMVLFNAKRI